MALSDRREQYRESLRQEIMDAARALFVESGYEATSIRRIAERIGASSGTLYHYFEDKPALMAQLVSEAFTRLNARLSLIAKDSAPPLDNLRRGANAYIRFGLENSHHYAVMFMKTEQMLNDERIKEVFRRDGFSCFDCLRRMTRDCVEAGALRAELTDVEEVAQSVWAAIHGITSILISCAGFPFIEPTRLIDRHVDILIEGVRRR